VAALSRVLLGQAGTLPRGDEPLRIAPDGALRYLPFELLEDPRDRSVPLVEGTTVSYLPSASTLRGGRSPELEGVRLLGVGNPRLSRPGSGPAGPRELLVERFGLAPLAAAGREIGTAARLLGGRSVEITGDGATEAAFRQAVARGARVVHLATHTVIDERPGRGAAILLAPGDGYDSDDGLLTPDEIARLDDRSALTVLAACRTALGPGEDGQALSSLTGSFLAAGSQSVVATLWDVGDTATAAFMEQLYWELGQGLAPAEALRAAKRRFRTDPRWNRSDLWAGYVLVGEAPPVVPRKIPWALWGGLLAAAILAWIVLSKPTGSRSSRSVSPP
jgi:CHAT domain-containing protein